MICTASSNKQIQDSAFRLSHINKQLPHLSSVAESVKSVPLEIAIYLSVMLLLHSSSDRKVLSCSAIDRVILMMLSGRIHKSPPPQKRLVNAGFNTTILVPVR